MTIRTRTLFSGALLATAGLLLPVAASAQEKPAAPVDDTHALDQFSNASQALSRKVSASLVHVKLDQIVMGMSREEMRRFEEWRQKQGNAGAHPRGHAGNDPAASTMPARSPNGGGGGSRIVLLKKFLEQEIKDSTDPETQTRMKAVLARLDAIRNGHLAAQQVEMVGVVVDDQAHVVVAGWVRENQGQTFHVTIPDGTETTAKFVGAHWGRGLAVLKLESAGSTVAAPLATASPIGGELFMCLGARQGAVGWVTAPAAPEDGKKSEDRFPILADDRGGSYLFNTKGEFAAVGIDRWALPASALKSDIDWIIKNNKDIPGLGVHYVPLPAELRKSTPALGDRPAVVVNEIVPGSAADRAKLKKNDIVLTIDGRSVSQLFTIQSDLATKTGTVSMGILRDGKEMSLDLPLDQ